MKRATSLILALALAALIFSGCGAPAATTGESVTVTFDFQKQDGYATNQFAVWVEDENGAFVKTLFATRFTAEGGYVERPASLPIWVERADAANAKDLDAVTGATPNSGSLSYVWDLTDESGARVADGTYRFFVEGTLRYENQVLYSGEIAIGGAAASAEATAAYTYAAAADDQPALTAESPENAMLGNVKAAYTPAQQ